MYGEKKTKDEYLSNDFQKLQISTFYFPPFEKADYTIFTLLVSRLVGVTINLPSANVFLHFLLGFSSSPEQNNNKNNNNNNDDHPYGPASCKRSSGWTGLFQKIIWRDRSLANDQNSNMRFALLTWTSFLLFVHIMIISHLPSYRKHFLGDKAPYI